MTAGRPAATTARQETDDTPVCPQCGNAGLMSARFPHIWHGHTGQPVRGFKEAVLCAACDDGEGTAAELSALIDAQGAVRPEDVETFILLAGAWIDNARRRAPDSTALAEQERRWHLGEL
ncbi:DUF6300 family protein [Streptomyces sp. NPDC048595]|uniref:DUF6300 family protein n=1 Tax=Streptomyces sp. NPDC048595 TaxID=3365576 RepID=UPI00371A7D80